MTLTPSALTPSPLIAAAPFAPSAYSPAAPLPVLPASAISPASPAPLKPSGAGVSAAAARALLGAAPQDVEKTPIEELIAYTKRLFGESDKPGFSTAEYLKPGAPLEFGSTETAAYRSALDASGAKSRAEPLAALVDAAEALAKSAGIAVESGERSRADGTVTPVLKITPERNGHRLNRLAWDLEKSFDTAMEYAPDRTDGGVAAFNSALQVLFLPDFGRDDAYEAILHESRHAAFTKRLKRGDLSVFHASLVAYPRRAIAPGASSYVDYMSLEELSTHAKTLLHDVLRAQRGGAKGVSAARADAYQFADVLRSAEINLFQLQRLGSLKSYRLTGESWPDIPGGHWEAVNLPHAILVVPVLDGPLPTKKRTVWERLFKDDPEPEAVLIARRHAEVLRPLVAALSRELEAFLGATAGDAPDLKKARASAARMTSLASEADKKFAAGR